jgi:hypothetical protein
LINHLSVDRFLHCGALRNDVNGLMMVLTLVLVLVLVIFSCLVNVGEIRIKVWHIDIDHVDGVTFVTHCHKEGIEVTIFLKIELAFLEG